MMASPSELSLECKPHSFFSMLLKSFGDQQQQSDQTCNRKLEEFLARLEEERLKIDAFKRELPLCMQLLTNAMEASRQQLQSYRANNQAQRPVLEEFIPLKNSSNPNDGGVEKMEANMAAADKANWMTSAQLWSDQAGNNEATKQKPIFAQENDPLGFSMSPKVVALDNFFNKRDNNNNNGVGALLPFSKDGNSSSSCPTPTLALASSCDHSNKDNIDDTNNNVSEIVISNLSKGNIVNHNNEDAISTISQPGSQTTTATAAAAATSQPQRKARRCWSPDLHRRFVNALQMLGGSQVATPKQIRELMKVDGLTNDEVKSHLQKYRLHTRRPIPSPQTAASGAPQLVVLGGIWVPSEYAAAAHGGAPAATLYGTHPSTAHALHVAASQQHYYAAAAAPQHHHEFYSAPPPPLHHQLHVYNPPSHHEHSHISPVSGDRSESIEDGQSSESGGSWKANSGSESGGGERKVLVLKGKVK